MESSELEDHIVIIGWNALGNWVARQLLAADQQVAVVTDDPSDRDVIREEFGADSVFVSVNSLNDFSKLDSVRIPSCRKVFVNFANDDDSLIAVLGLQEEFGSDLAVDVVVHNDDLRDTFYVAGANYTVSPRSLSSRIIATHVFEQDVGEFTSEFIHATESDDDIEFQQYRIRSDHPLCGETYESVFWTLKREYNCVVLGLSRREPGGGRELHKLPGDTVL
ncbi:MAG: NAD-binding protein [Bradymonadaceae bacterium]